MITAPGTRSNRDVLLRFYEILNTGEADAADEVYDPDVVIDWPQTGERVRGLENLKATLRNYPGGNVAVNPEHRTFIDGDEGRYVLTPMFTMVKVVGSGDTLVGTTKTRYPDGSDWWVIGIASFRAGKIVKVVQYFAPALEPPAWRSQWVELVEAGPSG
jgi:ketosteroid isomerase-like protein